VRSTGLEPGLVDATTPPVTFVRTPIAAAPTTSSAETASPFGRRFGPQDLATADAPSSAPLSGGITLLDFDGDGDLDLFVVSANIGRLLRNDGGTYADVTAESGLGGAAGGVACVAGDYDNMAGPTS